jgi:hypothetical protein
VDEVELRSIVYRSFAATGRAPTRAALDELVGDASDADTLLQSMHDQHMIVLDERPATRGEIRMALPFSSEPTGFDVTSEVPSLDGRWWANCAWDSFAVVAALDIDARIEATWMDTGQPVDITIANGSITGPLGDDTPGPAGFVHFAVPASRWWDDIVET